MVQRQRIQPIGQPRQLMIMGREQGPRLDLVMHRLDHRPGDRQPVIGRRAAADLVEDHQAVGRCLGEDRRGLDHFDHEGRTAAGKIVGCADARLNSWSTMPILARAAGNIAAGLGEQGGDRHLAQEGRLAAHVGPGDQPQPVARSERAVIGDKPLALGRQRLLDHRMARRLRVRGRAGRSGAAGTSRPRRRARRMAGGNVDPGDGIGGRGDAPAPPQPRARSNPRNVPASAASAWAPASTTRLASAWRSGELNRTTPASVWRWVKPESGAISRSACLAATSI